MEILVTSDSDELHENLKADSRGRVTLGSDYANKTVSVAVVDTNEEQ